MNEFHHWKGTLKRLNLSAKKSAIESLGMFVGEQERKNAQIRCDECKENDYPGFRDEENLDNLKLKHYRDAIENGYIKTICQFVIWWSKANEEQRLEAECITRDLVHWWKKEATEVQQNEVYLTVGAIGIASLIFLCQERSTNHEKD